MAKYCWIVSQPYLSPPFTKVLWNKALHGNKRVSDFFEKYSCPSIEVIKAKSKFWHRRLPCSLSKISDNCMPCDYEKYSIVMVHAVLHTHKGMYWLAVFFSKSPIQHCWIFWLYTFVTEIKISSSWTNQSRHLQFSAAKYRKKFNCRLKNDSDETDLRALPRIHIVLL